MKKGYLQISFAWIFAIIAGIFILSLAIYGVTKLITTEETVQTARTGEEIGILLNPLETSFETGKVTSLGLPVETRIYNKCNNEGEFGRQLIQISQKSFNKWTETEIDAGFSNKYIFSESVVEGENFYLFSKPFNFPFKIADLIYLTSSKENYCFLNAPEEIEEEISDLQQKNVFVDDCPDANKIEICFSGSSDCDITVNYNLKYVEKRGERMYFENDVLMYAAIFSGKDIYECQLKRLMQRLENLALLYHDKASFVSRINCNSNLNLLELSNMAENLGSSANLGSVKNLVDDIEEKNNDVECRLW